MTTQQTDIEKTLKRILAREWTTWPKNAIRVTQEFTGVLMVEFKEFIQQDACLQVASDQHSAFVTRAEWEAERALLASEQAQPGGDAEEFDQALWDRVAVAAVNGEMSCQSNATKRLDAGDLVRYSFAVADAFMAERAKRISARKASHD